MNFCFTLNNPTEDEESEIQVTRPEVLYVVYGHEYGTNNTHHLQGYLELAKRLSIPGIKKLLNNPRMHLEARKGTQSQAIQYCKKDQDRIYERGTMRQGRGRPTTESKNKLLPFIPEIKRSMAEFANHPEASLHMLKHAKEYMSLAESPRKRSDPLQVVWLWGPTGTGKTRKVFDFSDQMNLPLFTKSSGNKWFDGYEAQPIALLDDFRDTHYEFSFLLRLLDIYPLKVEIKGTFRQWKPQYIFITAPMPPEETYKNMQMNDKYDKVQQLLRRITITEKVTSYDGNINVNDYKIRDPQTPQGGLNKGLMINSPELLTPPYRYYPLNRSPAYLPLPPLPREDFVSPGLTPSQTQIWPGPRQD